MSDTDNVSKPDRLALPRDGIRAQLVSAAPNERPVVTSHYEEERRAPQPTLPPKKPDCSHPRTVRDPFRAYGERSSSRPYALRLPEPIDRILRHIAAEERTQPLRIIDRAIYDYLQKIERLPPESDG